MMSRTYLLLPGPASPPLLSALAAAGLGGLDVTGRLAAARLACRGNRVVLWLPNRDAFFDLLRRRGELPAFWLGPADREARLHGAVICHKAEYAALCAGPVSDAAPYSHRLLSIRYLGTGLDSANRPPCLLSPQEEPDWPYLLPDPVPVRVPDGKAGGLCEQAGRLAECGALLLPPIPDAQASSDSYFAPERTALRESLRTLSPTATDEEPPVVRLLWELTDHAWLVPLFCEGAWLGLESGEGPTRLRLHLDPTAADPTARHRARVLLTPQSLSAAGWMTAVAAALVADLAGLVPGGLDLAAATGAHSWACRQARPFDREPLPRP